MAGMSTSPAEPMWNGSLLAIAPHAQFFLGDQLSAVRPLVREVTLMIPSPVLAGVFRRLPGLSDRYASLNRARATAQGLAGGAVLRPKYLHYPGSFLRGYAYASAASSAVSALRRSAIDFQVAHAHFVGLSGFVGASIKRALGKPLIVSAYGGDVYRLPLLSEGRRRMAESIVGGADRLIAVSESVARGLVALGADESRISVIPTGFDQSLFKPSDQGAARSELGLPPGRPILLSVANLVPQKGHGYLLEALKSLMIERKDVLLAVVGGGPLEAELKRKTAQLGLDSNIAFVGPKPHQEIPRWMSACDLFVLPSVEEGSPTVLTEAMACGKPVVACDVGGVSDLIEEGKQGQVVPPKDAGALAEAMARALEESWDSRLILARSEGFAWTALARRIVGIYSELSPG